MAAFVGKDTVALGKNSGKWKYMSETEMEELSSKFKPYRQVPPKDARVKASRIITDF